MDERLFYGSENNIDTSVNNQTVARTILERFSSYYNSFSFTMSGNGIISQGLFIMQSVCRHNPNVECIKNSQYRLGDLHFVPAEYTEWERRAISFCNNNQNPELHPENAYLYATNRLSFNVGINDNCNLYTNSILRKIYNIYPQITLYGYTNCRTRDMWPSTPHSFPIISTWGVTGEGGGGATFPHIQQPEFSVSTIDTKITNIGEKDWGKKVSTLINKAKTFGTSNSGSLSTDDYCDGTADANASKAQLEAKMKSPTRNVIFLNEFVRVDNSRRLCYKAAGMCDGYENFDRNTLLYTTIADNNLGINASVFYNNKFFDIVPNASSRKYKDLIAVPILFTKIGGEEETYGDLDEWRKNERSLTYMIGICSCAAKIFATENTSYSDFNIYFTKNPQGENPDVFETLNISYAIDLRPVANGGSAVDGKIKITDYKNSTDILAIANKNIYILSLSQVNNYITPPSNIKLSEL